MPQSSLVLSPSYGPKWCFSKRESCWLGRSPEPVKHRFEGVYEWRTFATEAEAIAFAQGGGKIEVGKQLTLF